MTHPAAPSSNLPNWQPFFAAGEYRRALAAARLLSAPALPALESLFSFQEELRAQRYPLAQTFLTRLSEDLAACPDPQDAATLRGQLDPERLQTALTSLITAKEAHYSDSAALSEALLAALSEPLTRAEALNRLGVLYALQEDHAAAKAQFEAALSADPLHYRAQSNLGNLALQEGDLDSAEQHQRQALALNPDFAGAHHNLGVVLRKKGKLSESVSHIKKAQRLEFRAAHKEKPAGAASWMTPQNMRLLGIALAVVAFLLWVKLR